MKATALFLCLVASCGCVNLNKTINALARDPATVHLSVRSIYVTLELDRTAPTTNQLAHTVKDGTITVTK